jgi:hypothetical protein
LVEGDIVAEGEEEVVVVVGREETQLCVSYLQFGFVVEQSIPQHPQGSCEVHQGRLVIHTLQIEAEECIVH